MTQEEEMWLRELAAERCVISKVTARLGPMSLWSNDALKAEIRRAVEAEREACAKLCDDLDDDLPDGLAGWQYGEAIRARGEA